MAKNTSGLSGNKMVKLGGKANKVPTINKSGKALGVNTGGTSLLGLKKGGKVKSKKKGK